MQGNMQVRVRATRRMPRCKNIQIIQMLTHAHTVLQIAFASQPSMSSDGGYRGHSTPASFSDAQPSYPFHAAAMHAAALAQGGSPMHPLQQRSRNPFGAAASATVLRTPSGSGNTPTKRTSDAGDVFARMSAPPASMMLGGSMTGRAGNVSPMSMSVGGAPASRRNRRMSLDSGSGGLPPLPSMPVVSSPYGMTLDLVRGSHLSTWEPPWILTASKTPCHMMTFDLPSRQFHHRDDDLPSSPPPHALCDCRPPSGREPEGRPPASKDWIWSRPFSRPSSRVCPP